MLGRDKKHEYNKQPLNASEFKPWRNAAAVTLNVCILQDLKLQFFLETIREKFRKALSSRPLLLSYETIFQETEGVSFKKNHGSEKIASKSEEIFLKK